MMLGSDSRSRSNRDRIAWSKMANSPSSTSVSSRRAATAKAISQNLRAWSTPLRLSSGPKVRVAGGFDAESPAHPGSSGPFAEMYAKLLKFHFLNFDSRIPHNLTDTEQVARASPAA